MKFIIPKSKKLYKLGTSVTITLNTSDYWCYQNLWLAGVTRLYVQTVEKTYHHLCPLVADPDRQWFVTSEVAEKHQAFVRSVGYSAMYSDPVKTPLYCKFIEDITPDMRKSISFILPVGAILKIKKFHFSTKVHHHSTNSVDCMVELPGGQKGRLKLLLDDFTQLEFEEIDEIVPTKSKKIKKSNLSI